MHYILLQSINHLDNQHQNPVCSTKYSFHPPLLIISIIICNSMGCCSYLGLIAVQEYS